MRTELEVVTGSGKERVSTPASAREKEKVRGNGIKRRGRKVVAENEKGNEIGLDGTVFLEVAVEGEAVVEGADEVIAVMHRTETGGIEHWRNGWDLRSTPEFFFHSSYLCK